MAKTWMRGKKNDPTSKVDALAARRVLRDCYRAKQELHGVDDEHTWRLRWLTMVTLLRAVGHVLAGVDGKRSKELKQAITDAYKRWKSAPHLHLIFHEFMKKERDLALKEYQVGVSVILPLGDVAAAPHERPVLFGGRLVGQVQLISEAIDWWEAELERIEEEAKVALHGTAPRQGRKKAPTRRSE